MSAGAGAVRRTPGVVLFTEDEHLVLGRWFEERTTRRSCTHGEEMDRALDALGVPDACHNDDVLGRVEIAVARILLEADEQLLPNWYCWDEDGEEHSARSYRGPEERPRRKVALRSQHILTINWADGGPGMSWPESYRLIWVPGYERWVVTVSCDFHPNPGCEDAALGTFEAGADGLEAPIGEILRHHWELTAGYDQPAWAYLFTEGLVSEATALAWRDAVWPEPSDG